MNNSKQEFTYVEFLKDFLEFYKDRANKGYYYICNELFRYSTRPDFDIRQLKHVRRLEQLIQKKVIKLNTLRENADEVNLNVLYGYGVKDRIKFLENLIRRNTPK